MRRDVDKPEPGGGGAGGGGGAAKRARLVFNDEQRRRLKEAFKECARPSKEQQVSRHGFALRSWACWPDKVGSERNNVASVRDKVASERDEVAITGDKVASKVTEPQANVAKSQVCITMSSFVHRIYWPRSLICPSKPSATFSWILDAGAMKSGAETTWAAKQNLGLTPKRRTAARPRQITTSSKRFRNQQDMTWG